MERPERLDAALAEGLAGLFVTVGADRWPHAAFTWAAAPARERVRAIADWPGTTLANVQANGGSPRRSSGQITCCSC